MALRRIAAILIALLIVLPLLLAGGLLLLAQSRFAETFIAQRAADALGREVEIDGIAVRLTWPPVFSFDHLRIANPDWAETPNLVDAHGLDVHVAAGPLLHGKLVIPYLHAARAAAGLEIAGKRATWRFGKDSGGENPLTLTRVQLDDGRIRYIDKDERTDLDVRLEGSLGENGKLSAQAKGRFRGEPTTARASIPALTPQHRGPVQIDGSAASGKTKLAIKGKFAPDGRTLDVELALAGPSLEKLNKLAGIVLPESPPYQVRGQLQHTGNAWRFDPFQGKVGDSDVRGSLLYRKGGTRPFLQAQLHSNVLDFDDLGPLIGAPPKTGAGETAAPHQRAKAARKQKGKRILPDHRFGTEAWSKMDADVRLDAKRVLRAKELPIDSLQAHLVLKDSVVHLTPLNFGFAGGRITSDITLSAQRRPPRGDIRVDVQGLKLRQLFPTSESMREALGTLYGEARLVGQGNSVAALLGTSDGKASLAVDGGRISALLIELIGLDAAESVMLLGAKHDQTRLRCAVGNFEVKDGLARIGNFIVDTADTIIKVDGAVSLMKEQLDLVARPYPKDPSPLAVRTPLVIKGAMKDPSVRPEAGPLAARAAGAALLAAIAPPLALLALIETGPGKNANCGALLAQAKAKGAVKKQR